MVHLKDDITANQLQVRCKSFYFDHFGLTKQESTSLEEVENTQQHVSSSSATAVKFKSSERDATGSLLGNSCKGAKWAHFPAMLYLSEWKWHSRDSPWPSHERCKEGIILSCDATGHQPREAEHDTRGEKEKCYMECRVLLSRSVIFSTIRRVSQKLGRCRGSSMRDVESLPAQQDTVRTGLRTITWCDDIREENEFSSFCFIRSSSALYNLFGWLASWNMMLWDYSSSILHEFSRLVSDNSMLQLVWLACSWMQTSLSLMTMASWKTHQSKWPSLKQFLVGFFWHCGLFNSVSCSSIITYAELTTSLNVLIYVWLSISQRDTGVRRCPSFCNGRWFVESLLFGSFVNFIILTVG